MGIEIDRRPIPYPFFILTHGIMDARGLLSDMADDLAECASARPRIVVTDAAAPHGGDIRVSGGHTSTPHSQQASIDKRPLEISR